MIATAPKPDFKSLPADELVKFSVRLHEQVFCAFEHARIDARLTREQMLHRILVHALGIADPFVGLASG